MVKDKPQLCMSGEMGLIPKVIKEKLGTIRFQTLKLVDIIFSFSDTHILIPFRSAIGYLDRLSP